eukprot:TRINITY_DN6586_c0_g2_i2.p1 TRINITY_DN6586_c0_g2~~TRINITY_DN6586_c0_g2_i2.p1  ORF type:complete len:254 (+),score=37.83 TRINITY_DN6586_c0_g2_i2:221-982(+)
MNEREVSRQIDQMVMFITQEAEEKANEIRVSAEEEFNLEKLNLLETEKQRIRKEYERKESQVEAQKKIESSKQFNEQRLKVLGAKQDLIHDVLNAAKNKIKQMTKGGAYADLVTDLLCQAMYKLQEDSQIVQCRQEDLKTVENAITKAQAAYKKKYNAEAPQLTLDRKHFLAPGAKNQSEEDDPDCDTCLGGVVVTTQDGRIVVNNTLDARMKIVEDQQLPAIRASLFQAADIERGCVSSLVSIRALCLCVLH